MTNAFHYYPPEATQPLLCEVNADGVWFMDAERAKFKRDLPGRFVPLIEAPTQLPVGIPAVPNAIIAVDYTRVIVLMEKGQVRE